ncbi:ankyrin repeat domain-containing protein, partial [Chlamydiia bacterium]|nr:ankyrin repeat domain-containing protein [Chlamydiia bacterium]
MPKYNPTHILSYAVIALGFASCAKNTSSGSAPLGTVNLQSMDKQLLHEPIYSVPFTLKTDSGIHIDDTIDIDLLSYCVLTHDYENVTSLLNHNDILGRHIIDVNTTDHTHHISPLFIAIIQHDMRMLRLLLQRDDLDTNLPGIGGHPAISYAINHGMDKELIIRLMEHPSMDINTPNSTENNFTPLMYAIMAGDNHMIDYIVNYPNVDFGKESTIDNEGLNAVMLAAKNNHPYAIDAIAYECPNVLHTPSLSNRYPIYYAIAHHHVDCMQACISHGGVNQPCDNENTSPLMLACHYHHDDMATLLLHNENIDLNITNNSDQTVVDVAYAVGFDHVIAHVVDNLSVDYQLINDVEHDLPDHHCIDPHNHVAMNPNQSISFLIDDDIVDIQDNDIQTDVNNELINVFIDKTACDTHVCLNDSQTDVNSDVDPVKTTTDHPSKVIPSKTLINNNMIQVSLKTDQPIITPSDCDVKYLTPSHYTYDTH